MEEATTATQVGLLVGLAIYPIVGFFSSALLNTLSGRKLEEDPDMVVASIICWPISWLIFLLAVLVAPVLNYMDRREQSSESLWLRTTRRIEARLGFTQRNERNEQKRED